MPSRRMVLIGLVGALAAHDADAKKKRKRKKKKPKVPPCDGECRRRQCIFGAEDYCGCPYGGINDPCRICLANAAHCCMWAAVSWDTFDRCMGA